MLHSADGTGEADDGHDNDVHLRPGDGMKLDGKLFVVQSRSTKPHGYIVADPHAAGIEHKFRNRDIKDWHDRGRLRFVMASEGRLPLAKQESLERTLRAFTEVEQAEMYRRQRYCVAVDAKGAAFVRTETAMTALSEEVAALHGDTAPHGWASINEWWVDWDRAGRDIRVLCPSYRRRGNRDRRLEPFMLKALETGVMEWLDMGRPKMATKYIDVISECMDHHGGKAVCEAILEKDPEAWLWPSYKTFTIACRSVDRATKLSRRHGPRAVRSEMHPVGDGSDVRLPFQRVEADFKYLRIFVVDDANGFPLGTPYLMAAIDCFSGMVAGFDLGFDPPSYLSAARCLKHVMGFKDELDKLPLKEDGTRLINNAWPVNGVPHTFVLDNDAAFHAESFEKSAKALGCHIDFVPPGQPWDKGKIERFWGTVQTSYVDMFPGNVLRLDQHPDLDYRAEDGATITLSQLRLFLTKALVDVHHIGIEPGTYKRRIDLWNEAVAINPPRPVRDHGSLLELVGAYKKRRAERRGIRLFGLRYTSDDLHDYRNGFDHDPMVEVRYDPQDISVVHVIDREQGTSFEVKCSRPDYAKGLSEHQHKVIQHQAKKAAGLGRLRMAELLIAKKDLFDLGRAMIGKRRKKSPRAGARLAQFLGIGRELIDEMARHHENVDESARPADVEDPVDDPEDDARARLEEQRFAREGAASPVVAPAKSEPAAAPLPVAADTPPTPATHSDPEPPRRRPRPTMKVRDD